MTREDPILRELPPVAVGLRSSLRVPLLRDGRAFGGLNFLSRDIGRFALSDVPVAQRVAAYVALTLAHQDYTLPVNQHSAPSHRGHGFQIKVSSLNHLHRRVRE